MTDNAFNTDHDTELLTLLYTMVHVQKKNPHYYKKCIKILLYHVQNNLVYGSMSTLVHVITKK